MQNFDEESAWKLFLATRDEAARTWLIERYRPLVERAMRRFRGVRQCDRDDLRGAGYLGLVRAVDEWRPGGMPWLDFARFKIRCAAVDHIRSWSWQPKGLRNQGERLDQAEELLTGRLGRKPTLDELAAELGITADRCEELIASVRATNGTVVSIEGSTLEDWARWEALPDPDAPDPAVEVLAEERHAELNSVLGRLPSRLRDVLESCYLRGERQTDIAQRYGCHESRISQLIEEALGRARALAYEKPLVLGGGR